jgi:hypothetical protein
VRIAESSVSVTSSNPLGVTAPDWAPTRTGSSSNPPVPAAAAIAVHRSTSRLVT